MFCFQPYPRNRISVLCRSADINCENGVMKVTMTADFGAWIQTKSSETCDRNRAHQGSRRRAGPSYLQRQKRRAAVRAGASAAAAAKQATAAAAEQAPATTAEQAPASSKPIRTCMKCSQPCNGHNGPTGDKCSNARQAEP